MKRYSQSKKKFYFILIMLFILSIGIGYAVLTEKLTIYNTVSYNSMKWDIGFSSASDNGGSVTAVPTISSNKKSLSIACDIGTSTEPETCVVLATIKNGSTFNIQLKNAPTITYDNTYISSVVTTWNDTNSDIKANDYISADNSRSLQITITTKKITEDMLPEENLSLPITITMDWIEATVLAVGIIGDEPVVLGGITLAEWTGYDGGGLETVSNVASNYLSPTFLTPNTATQKTKANLLMAGTDYGFSVGDEIKVQNKACYTSENDNTAIYIITDDGTMIPREEDVTHWCQGDITYNELVVSYPENSTYDSFTIPKEQSTRAGMELADWRTAAFIGYTPEGHVLNTNFEHMLTKIEFVFSFGNEFEDVFIENIDVYSQNTRLSYDGNNLTGDGIRQSIRAYNDENGATAIISPGYYGTEEVFAIVNINGEELNMYMPEGLELESGNFYRFYTQLGGDVLEIGDVVTVPWTEEDLGSGNFQNTSDFVFEEGAEISFFVTGGTKEKHNANNVKWIYEDDWWYSETNTIFDTRGYQKAYALYPYIEEITDNNIHINIEEQIDYLYSSVQLLDRTCGGLEMEHVLAKIRIYPAFSNAVGINIESIKIKNMIGSASFDIESGRFYGLSEKNALVETHSNYEALVIPDEDASQITLIVTLDNGTTKEITVDTPDGLEQGVSYNISIEI